MSAISHAFQNVFTSGRRSEKHGANGQDENEGRSPFGKSKDGGPYRFSKDHEYPQLNFEARPKHIKSQTKARLNQFHGGHYSSQNLSSLLFAHRIDSGSHPDNVSMTCWSAPGRSKPDFATAVKALAREGKVARKGMEFGPSWTNHWFKITLRIPSEWSEYETIQFEFDGSGEAMIFNTEGCPLQGLTGGFSYDRRVEWIIPPAARKAQSFTFYVESSCNGMFGIDNMDPPDPNRYYLLESADVVVPNMDAWRLYWDFTVLHQVSEVLPDDSPLANKAMYVANEMMNTFESGSLESVRECRKVAEKILGHNWEENLVKSRQGKEVGRDADGTLWGTGHCHIDTAWLWPFSVTQQKIARSWSTQVDLMDRYPEHRFSCTQAQQYKWLEELYPQLFDKVRARVLDGRFQVVGATWVEMDVNMPSGESLCRQFLYGQRYFQSRFGIRCPTFVLPDTFGYSSQLPQIARMSGCKNFFTQKLSWNSINSFPHSTFNWIALDGSQILTHMTPVNNYNSQCNVDDIRRGVTGHKNLEVTQQALLLFGNGDGGGGPTPPMLERLRRTRAVALNENCGGGDLPLLKMGADFDEFFDSVREETENADKLPNWRGELYFELHRGTYTSHGSIKKGNRKNEFLLREVELTATMASVFGGKDYKYPKKAMDVSWEDLLLCQFHDVLPGSGIAMIYEDAERKYAAMHASSTQILEDALQVLYPGSKAVPSADGSSVVIDGKGQLIALNNVPRIARREVLPVKAQDLPQMVGVAAQINKSGNGNAFVLAECPSGHHQGAVASSLAATANPVGVQESDAQTFVMENSSLNMKVADGRIVSIFDKLADRELLPEGETAGFVMFQDQPHDWDAWDVDIYHLEKFKRLKFSSVKILETGPLRATLGCSFTSGDSKMEVQISMDAVPASFKEDARSLIRFHNVVDWREKHKFLKFELPLNVYNDNATYDTQFGLLQRPTHRNTSWDNAKFEVCAHKFADLSEYGYGVAILNDCKYGYAVEGNVMRLSLLRAPTMPDADCDMGVHEFSFAIYPHAGSYGQSDVYDVAYAFNNPMKLRYLPDARAAVESHYREAPFSIVNAPNVFIETVKRGEDDDFESNCGKKTIVLRVFEHMGGHARAYLRFSNAMNIAKANIANILEDELETLSIKPASSFKALSTTAAAAAQDVDVKAEDSVIELNFRGFEIKTIKLELK